MLHEDGLQRLNPADDDTINWLEQTTMKGQSTKEIITLQRLEALQRDS